jgi:hypothetical protein
VDAPDLGRVKKVRRFASSPVRRFGSSPVRQGKPRHVNAVGDETDWEPVPHDRQQKIIEEVRKEKEAVE